MSGQRRNSAGKKRNPSRSVVVLVEDEPSLRAVWLELLREVGYQVYEAADGKSGLGLVRDIQPDVVITDLVMPVQDGRALATAIRNDAHLKNIPIIAATGDSPQPADVDLFDVVLRKPFNSAALLRALTELTVGVESNRMAARNGQEPIISPIRARRN